MKIIIITLPDPGVENEAQRISAMLESGMIERVHIRKPNMGIEEMRELISMIPMRLHSRLSLHSNPELLREYQGVGWHFSNNRPLANCSGTLSRSCHSLSEVAKWIGRCDYVTLSPVFDSISKPGYRGVYFNPEEEYLCCQAGAVVALGGVIPRSIPSLKERGYRGVAMLGYAWKTDLNQLIEELKCYNS